MAQKTLKALIQASGYAGTSGQSFRNHVAGAASGAKMSDYHLYAWLNWASSDYAAGTVYSYGATIHFTFDTQSGTRWSYIRRALAALDIILNDGTDPGSLGTVNIVGGGWDTRVDAGDPMHSIALQLYGAAQYYGFTDAQPNKVWDDWNSNTNPDPPGTDENYRITMVPNWTNTGPPIRSFTVHIHYPGDADFNDPLDYSFPVQVYGTSSAPPFDVEWYSDSAMTQLYSTDNPIRFLVGPSNPYGQFWARYRVNGGPWTSYPGAIQYWDTRVYSSYPG